MYDCWSVGTGRSVGYTGVDHKAQLSEVYCESASAVALLQSTSLQALLLYPIPSTQRASVNRCMLLRGNPQLPTLAVVPSLLLLCIACRGCCICDSMASRCPAALGAKAQTTPWSSGGLHRR